MLNFGEFTLHSGEKTWWKLDLDTSNFDADNLYNLAEHIYLKFSPFSLAVGVPRGGSALAEELNLFPLSPSYPVLIVEGVLTTGASMEQTAEPFKAMHQKVKGVCLVARCKRWELPNWVRPLFVMSEWSDVNDNNPYI